MCRAGAMRGLDCQWIRQRRAAARPHVGITYEVLQLKTQRDAPKRERERSALVPPGCGSLPLCPALISRTVFHKHSWTGM